MLPYLALSHTKDQTLGLMYARQTTTNWATTPDSQWSFKLKLGKTAQKGGKLECFESRASMLEFAPTIALGQFLTVNITWLL